MNKTTTLFIVCIFLFFCSGIIIGYLFGYMNGLLDVVPLIQNQEIMEFINYTSEVTNDYVVMEVHK